MRVACKQLNRFKVNHSPQMAEALINRGTTWTDREVKALLAIWGDSKIQEELDGAVRNQVVFQHISKQLKEQGIKRDWKQCRAKVKNLKTKYRKVKDNNGKTGKGRQTCKFYSRLDVILGHRPASVPSALLDTGDSSGTTPEIEDDSEEEEIDGRKSTLVMIHTHLPLLTCRWNSGAGTLPFG